MTKFEKHIHFRNYIKKLYNLIVSSERGRIAACMYLFMYYLKHEQQCFNRYNDTRRSRVSLGPIKHALQMF
jgi:hypothetical protein